jgi:hypothetical protein
MNITIQYFNPSSKGVIITGNKEDSDEIDVYYIGSNDELEQLRVFINQSIDQLQARVVS